MPLRWKCVWPAAAACLAGVTAGRAMDGGSPLFGVTLPAGYRDWAVVSVAREGGPNDDIRAILGNDIAIRAYREGIRPFPDGAVVARLAWRYVPSPENNAVFGREQSFIAGAPVNVQISVRDSRRYAATGGWGYGQFENGLPNRNEALLASCAPCHARAPQDNDRVFTRYAP